MLCSEETYIPAQASGETDAARNGVVVVRRRRAGQQQVDVEVGRRAGVGQDEHCCRRHRRHMGEVSRWMMNKEES